MVHRTCSNLLSPSLIPLSLDDPTTRFFTSGAERETSSRELKPPCWGECTLSTSCKRIRSHWSRLSTKLEHRLPSCC
eukprot:Gb_18081 [translate_table: standard]